MRRLNGQEVQAVSMSAIARALDTPPPVTQPLPDPAEQAKQARLQAEEKGYKDGLSKGMADSKREIDARVKSAEDALSRQYKEKLEELGGTRFALLKLMDGLRDECERLVRHAEDVAIEVAYVGVLNVLGERASSQSLVRELCPVSYTHLDVYKRQDRRIQPAPAI